MIGMNGCKKFVSHCIAFHSIAVYVYVYVCMHACKERIGKNRKEMTKQHATQIRA